ncbi:hypothetical protein DI43_14630 [Geobacillus sp. CAMR12739]|nr:hypothetical protein DI43_14630 [Geobacillus sp. CAMR12739]
MKTTEAGLWIGGEWRPAADGAMFDVIDPATGQVTARVANAGEKDVDAAVAIAEEAFSDRRWLSIPPLERGRILRRIAELIRQHHCELAQLMTRENGMPINLALFIEIPLAADCFDVFRLARRQAARGGAAVFRRRLGAGLYGVDDEGADRGGWAHHPVELSAFDADVENRPSAGGGLYDGVKTGAGNAADGVEAR